MNVNGTVEYRSVLFARICRERPLTFIRQGIQSSAAGTEVSNDYVSSIIYVLPAVKFAIIYLSAQWGGDSNGSRNKTRYKTGSKEDYQPIGLRRYFGKCFSGSI
jgi:hypothetical protein